MKDRVTDTMLGDVPPTVALAPANYAHAHTRTHYTQSTYTHSAAHTKSTHTYLDAHVCDREHLGQS